MTKNGYALGLIILLSAICLASVASAQTSWRRTYGGPNRDVGYWVQQTIDGGYIISGWTESFGAGSREAYLVKTDARGDTLWTRAYGELGWNEGYSVQQTAEGGYIVVGYAMDTWWNGDIYLVKTNASGDTLWTRTYGGPNFDEGYSVQQTADGGYFVAGAVQSATDTEDVYLMKTNPWGDTLWTRTYCRPGVDEGNSSQVTADGGYIIAGITRGSGTDTADVYLLKTNASGDTLWTRTYGGPGYDEAYSVQQTTDGGYIVAGYTESFGAGKGDVYIIKTNPSGDTLWTRTYGGPGNDCGYSVQQTTDGCYIVVGYTADAYVYLIKTNAQGDTIWSRVYRTAGDDGGSSVQQTSDGGYVIAGWTNTFGAGDYDVYLIKTDSLGNVGVAEPLPGHPLRPTRFLAQPSPFTSFARVPGHEAELFVLSDVTGRQVAICKGDRVGEGLRPGVYFLSPVGLRAGRAATATIVKTAY